MYTLKIFEGGIFPRYVHNVSKAHAARLAAYERSLGSEVEIYQTVGELVSLVE